MKKISLLLSLLLGIMTATCFAQEDCKMCGTWIGKWYGQQFNNDTDEWDYGYWHKYIRIDKYGDEYKIRIKLEFPNHNYTSYESDDCTIISTSDNLIRFKLTSKLLPDYYNDNITGYGNMERFYELYYKNGYVHLKRYAQIQYNYDRHKNFIREWDAQEMAETGFGDDIDMYNEKDNW